MGEFQILCKSQGLMERSENAGTDQRRDEDAVNSDRKKEELEKEDILRR